MLEEAWTGDGDEGGGQSARARPALGYQIVAHTLGDGRRIRPQPGADRLLAAPGRCGRTRNKALYLDGVRPQPESVQAMARWQEAERGTLGHRGPGAAGAPGRGDASAST